ncbi:lipase, partial [Xanthomonas translucens pv. translucens]|nr:lipase [Xanthomonas translucens pv. translucens]
SDGKQDRSVLEDPAAQQLAQHYAPMIEKYRGDVASIRTGVTLGARSWQGLILDGVDELRGPLPPGTGRNIIGVPNWPEHMQQLNDTKQHGTAPQGWQTPLNVPEGMAAQPKAHVSLNEDPGAFLDRMLAAAQSGDRGQFRQMTKELANAEPGRALRAEAIETVNQQEHQAAQQTLQTQRQQVERQQQETPRIGARSL